jgi:hypothetical protein
MVVITGNEPLPGRIHGAVDIGPTAASTRSQRGHALAIIVPQCRPVAEELRTVDVRRQSVHKLHGMHKVSDVESALR